MMSKLYASLLVIASLFTMVALGMLILVVRGGPGCLNRFSALISGAS